MKGRRKTQKQKEAKKVNKYKRNMLKNRENSQQHVSHCSVTPELSEGFRTNQFPTRSSKILALWFSS